MCYRHELSISFITTVTSAGSGLHWLLFLFLWREISQTCAPPICMRNRLRLYPVLSCIKYLQLHITLQHVAPEWVCQYGRSWFEWISLQTRIGMKWNYENVCHSKCFICSTGWWRVPFKNLSAFFWITCRLSACSSTLHDQQDHPLHHPHSLPHLNLVRGQAILCTSLPSATEEVFTAM